jgi:predicted HicB family RNase H-like nuclease
MTREQEHAFYTQPQNQAPQGVARRRREEPSEMVTVRLPPDVMHEVRRRADQENTSVSSWIRRAVEHELGRTAR